MPSKFTRILQLGFGFSILILLAVGFFSYNTLAKFLASNKAVEHSSLVIQKLEKVLSLMKDAETGQRGYLLSNDKHFLAPYDGAYQNSQAITRDLKDLTKDNPVQQGHLNAVQDVLSTRMIILQALVIKKQNGQPITGTDLETGKSAMDALRQAVERAETAEQRLLKERTAQLGRYTQLAPVLIAIAVLLAIFIAVYSYLKLVGDMREKDRMRQSLELREQQTAAYNEELAAANEEVTAANEELTAINEELLEAREELATINNSLEETVDARTRALTESEAEAQALNEELTAINEELSAANEELQATNEDLAESQHQLQMTVDELKTAEERSAKLAAIVESSDDAIISKNFESIITSWNKGAERIFGYSEADMVGQSILRLIPNDRLDEEPQIISRLRNGERVEHFQTLRQTSDGRLIPVSLTISPIKDKEGTIIGISKIARDISEQKLNEQRKSDFIGMASHELKTPLTSLTALVQVVHNKLQHHPDTFIASALEKATFQAKKMTTLINGFLNVSRLESGKLVIDKKPFEISALISEVVEEAKLTVTTHSFVCDLANPIIVEGDRDKIGAVISNLVSNAIKYSPGQNEVIIRCSVNDGYVVVSVQDKGIGIDEKDIEKLFDRYYRVSSDQTKYISGFGVGLYLCAEIIERHDGSIRVDSEKGTGSTFTFTIPLSNNLPA